MEKNELITAVAEHVGKSVKYIKGLINKAYRIRDEDLGGAASPEAILRIAIIDAVGERYDFTKADLDEIVEGVNETEEEEDEDYDDDEDYDEDEDTDNEEEEDIDDEDDDEDETLQDFWDKIDEDAIIENSNKEFEKTPPLVRQAGVRYTFELPDPTAKPFKWYDAKYKSDKFIWKIILKKVFPREALREFNAECDNKDYRYKIGKKYSWFQTELCFALFKKFTKRFGSKGMIPPKIFTFKDTGKNDATRYKFVIIKKPKPKKKRPVKKKGKR